MTDEAVELGSLSGTPEMRPGGYEPPGRSGSEPNMEQMRAACESIYADFNGYWPSDSERERIASALKPSIADARDTRTALRQLAEAVDLGAGLRHDMDGHRKRYLECEVPGCVAERAALEIAKRVLVSDAPTPAECGRWEVVDGRMDFWCVRESGHEGPHRCDTGIEWTADAPTQDATDDERCHEWGYEDVTGERFCVNCGVRDTDPPTAIRYALCPVSSPKDATP